MGEYADEYLRREIQRLHGFEMEAVIPDKKKPGKCPACGKKCAINGLGAHMLAVHGKTEMEWRAFVDRRDEKKARK